MCGADRQAAVMLSYADLEGLVPQRHPSRAIRPLVNAALGRLPGRFEQVCAPCGQASTAPEKLPRALETATDGADHLHHDVPLVCRPFDGCTGVGQTVLRDMPLLR